MKANELRIGNYVLGNIFNTKEFVEAQIERTDFCDLTYLRTIKPIPLTEEWLLKFGFVENKFSLFSLFWCLDFNPRMSIRFFDGDSGDCDLTQDEKYISFARNHIKYVHTLQNLYFALTGKELKDE